MKSLTNFLPKPLDASPGQTSRHASVHRLESTGCIPHGRTQSGTVTTSLRLATLTTTTSSRGSADRSCVDLVDAHTARLDVARSERSGEAVVLTVTTSGPATLGQLRAASPHGVIPDQPAIDGRAVADDALVGHYPLVDGALLEPHARTALAAHPLVMTCVTGPRQGQRASPSDPVTPRSAGGTPSSGRTSWDLAAMR